MITTWRTSIVLVALLASLAGPTPPADAAPGFPPIAGVTVRYVPLDPSCTERCGPAPVLSVSMTTARVLTATCATSGALVVNGVTTPASCTTLRVLDVFGSTGADDVRVDLARGAVTVRVELGLGNDTGSVKTHSIATVLGGDGDDRLSTLLYLPASSDLAVVTGTLSGGSGRDTLTNLGFGPGTVPSGDPNAYGVHLSGDGGVDTVYGAAARADLVSAEWIDLLTLSGGPGQVGLSVGANADRVAVHLDGHYGPKVTITSGSTTKRFTLPTLTDRLQIATGLGNDTITVDHRSSRTTVQVEGGGGTDRLDVLPSLAFVQQGQSVLQPAPWKPIAWHGIETLTVRRVPRP